MLQPSNRYPRVLAWLPFLISVLVFVLVFSVQVQRNPLRGDEVDFFQCMRNVSVLGRPLYYAGEINFPAGLVQQLSSDILDGRSFRFYRFKPETGRLKETFFAITDGNSRYTYCLWHPPLYVYLGAMFFRLFDPPAAQANLFRFAHLVFVALMFLGIALMMRALHRPVWLQALSLAALGLACSNLSVVASAMVDYNGALAMCAVVWLVWAFLRADRDPRYAPLVTVLMAVTFGVGLGVASAALLGLLLWTVVLRRPAFVRHALSLAAGLALFLVVFFLSARIAHIPFTQPFLHNFDRASLKTPLSSRVVAVLTYMGWYVKEMSGSAVIVALILGLHRAWQLIAHRSAPSLRLSDARILLAPTLVLVTLLSQASLSGDAYGFPKYIAFALPLLFAFVAGEIVESARSRAWRLPAAALAAVLVISLSLQTLNVLRRPGGTLYMPGEQGFLAAASTLASNSQPGDVFLGSKDVSFYADRKFVEWFGALTRDVQLLRQRVDDEQVRFAVAGEGLLGSTSPAVRAWFADHTDLIAGASDNRVYRFR